MNREKVFTAAAPALGRAVLLVLACLALPASWPAAQPGSLDPSFDPGTGVDSLVYAATVQVDGKICIAGSFTSFNGVPKANLARLNSNGSLDGSFAPGAGVEGELPYVNAVAVQADGRILLAGSFTRVGGLARTNLARLAMNGVVDPNFAAETDESVNAVVPQSQGAMLIGGFFTKVNRTPRAALARLQTDGALDTAFNPVIAGDPFAAVLALAVQNDGRIVMGGVFTRVHGAGRTNIARLNADGSLDTSFDPGAGLGGGLSAAVNAVAVDPQGRLVVGGEFTEAQGLARTNIVRLNPDGTLDPSFSAAAGTDFPVNTIAVLPSSKVLMGGFFTMVNGTSRNYVAQLNSDGTLDTGFDPGTGADAVVYAVALQSDGHVVVGGGFTSFNGVPHHGLALLVGDTVLAAPRLFHPVHYGSTFTVQVPTVAGRSYELEFKNSLADTAWIPLPAVTGDGTVQTLQDVAATVSSRVYRIRER